MNKMTETFYGLECYISSVERRIKTSKCKLLDWIYEKLYGYEEVSIQEEDILHIPHMKMLIFKDKETFEKAKEIILSEVASDD